MRLLSIALLMTVVLPVGAYAQEDENGWLLEQEFFGFDPEPSVTFDPEKEVRPTLLVKGEKGELIFDAGEEDVQGIFPAPEAVREFDSLYTYMEFLVHELNAELVYDEEGLPVGWHLSTSLEGPAWYFNPDVDQYVYVTEPLEAYLGGRFGYVLIDGEPRCINPDRCDDSYDQSVMNKRGYAYPYRYNEDKYSIRVQADAKSNVYGTWRYFTACTYQARGGRSWHNLKAELLLTDLQGREVAHLTPKWTGSRRWSVCKDKTVEYWGPPANMDVNNFPYNVWGSVGWHYGEGNGEGSSAAYWMCGGSCAGTGCYSHSSGIGGC